MARAYGTVCRSLGVANDTFATVAKPLRHFQGLKVSRCDTLAIGLSLEKFFRGSAATPSVQYPTCSKPVDVAPLHLSKKSCRHTDTESCPRRAIRTDVSRHLI